MQKDRVVVILDDHVDESTCGLMDRFGEKLNEKLKLFVEDHYCYHVHKLLLIGDRKSGKTRLLERLQNNIYLKPDVKYDNPMPMARKTIFYNHDFVSGLLMEVSHYLPATIPDVYYKRVRGIIICYDISNRSTFDNVEMWIEKSKLKLNPKVECEIILVGTKSDIPSRQVSYQEGLEMSTKHQTKLFFETSSKTGENVNEMFYEFLKLLREFEDLYEKPTTNHSKESESSLIGNWCNIT